MQKLDFFKKIFFPIKIRIINLVSILLEYTIKKRKNKERKKISKVSEFPIVAYTLNRKLGNIGKF